MKRIAVIPGDGIGAEVIQEGLKILNALISRSSLPLSYQVYPDISGEGYLKTGVALSEERFEELKAYDAIYLGAVGDPRISDPEYAKKIILTLRFGLDLYVNLRPVKLLHPSFTPLEQKKNIDFVIVRENTEDLYVSQGGFFKKGTEDEIAIQESLNTYKGVHRIIEYAFRYAEEKGRKRITLVDKSNVLTYAHDLWQRVFWTQAKKHPGIQADHLYVDNAAQQLVKRPWEFQVMVTTNMFGDILSDLGGEIVGGLGIAPSGNINPESGKGMFEPVHGSAPKYAGQNVANPFAAILSLSLLLDYLGFQKEAVKVEQAVYEAIAGGVYTRDLGGTASTSQVGDFVAHHLYSSPGLIA